MMRHSLNAGRPESRLSSSQSGRRSARQLTMQLKDQEPLIGE